MSALKTIKGLALQALSYHVPPAVGNRLREIIALANDSSPSGAPAGLAGLLPSTYYADRDLAWRIEHLVSEWKRLIKVNQELEEKLAPSGAEVRPVWPTCPECGDKRVRLDFSAQGISVICFGKCISKRFPVQVLKDFAQFFPAPAETEAVRALREAIAEIKQHNSEYGHRTELAMIGSWERALSGQAQGPPEPNPKS